MKILLDENFPQTLRHEIQGHEIYTTRYMAWSGLQNGALLKVAAEAGFDVLVTNDRGLQYEQNLAELPLAVVILLAKSNTVTALRPLLAELSDVLATLAPKQLVKISHPKFTP